MAEAVLKFQAEVIRGMDSPVFRLNTGTLDISDLTPRFSLLRRRDGVNAGDINYVRIDAYNIDFVIPYATSNTLDYSMKYVLNISADNTDTGQCIPIAVGAIDVAIGEPHL